MLLTLLSPLLAQEYTDLPGVQLFRPTIDGGQTLWVDDTVIAEDQFQTRTLLHYTQDPLAYRNPKGEEIVLIGDVMQLDVMAGYGLGKFRIGAAIPVLLTSNGDAGGGSGLGDVRVDGKVALLNHQDNPIGLGLDLRLGLPTASVEGLGEGGLSWEGTLLIDHAAGPALLVAAVGARGGPQVTLANLTWDEQLVYRFGGGWSLSDAAGLSLELAGQSSLSDPSNVAGNPMDVLAGTWFRPNDGGLVLRGGVGKGLTDGIGSPRLRAMLGVEWAPTPKTRPTTTDAACPAEDMDGWKDKDGCAEPTEVTFAIVGATSGVTLRVDGQVIGAPYLLDLAAGPHTIEASAPGFEATAATVQVPEGPPYRHELKLVELADVRFEVLDPNGQPVEANVRIEGVDAALSGAVVTQKLAAGTWTVSAVRKGMRSVTQKVTVEAGEDMTVRLQLLPPRAALGTGRIELRENIYFTTAKAEILPDSYALLDEVAMILLEHPEIRLLRIEGHTDAQGDSFDNLELSGRRALAVRDYLISKGVSADRLEAIGFGESQPLVAGDTEEAYAKNRRVELVVVR